MKLITLILFFTLLHLTVCAQDFGQKVYASDATSGQYFGKSVSLSGQFAFIGAPGARNDSTDSATGAVYVFNKTGANWQFLEKLVEPDISNMANYGFAVDNNEDYAIIGAPRFGSSGAAYVYKRRDTHWERQLKLPEYYRSEFGNSVAIDSNTIVVGAPDSTGWGPSFSGRGAALVFTKTGSEENETWTEVSQIAASDGYDNGHFGYDVDISGSTIIVGAFTSSADYPGRSASYIYQLENGSWVQKQRLFPEGSDTTTSGFGICVSIFKETAAVSAPGEYHDNTVNGAVYIFEKNMDTWEEKAKIISPDPDSYRDFGKSIDLLENKLIIGAQNAVYLYEKIQTTWQLTDSVHNDYQNNGFVYNTFGASVSIADSAFLVGAIDDSDQGSGAGASHFYEFTPNPSTNMEVQYSLSPVRVYPNPVGSILQIDHVEENNKIFIYNSMGVKLKELVLRDGYIIDLSEFKSGIYILGIINDAKEIQTAKVIKY